MILVLVVIPFLIAAATDLFTLLESESVRYQPSPLDELQWETQCESAQLFASADRRDRPALVRGKWVRENCFRAMHWTKEDLIQCHRGLVNATEIVGPLPRKSTYRTPRERFPVPSAPRITKQLMSIKELLTPRPDRARYFSANIDFFHSCHHRSLLDDFPSESCFYHHFAADNRDPNSNVTHLWISSGKASAGMHYDATFNFFMQIWGTKSFVLFPPSELRKLYLFPFMSELSRQCAIDNVDFVANPTFSFERFENVSAYKVILEPGDLLYLPPFWVHRVESQSDLSLSINAWSDVEEVYKFDVVLPRIVLPFEMDWSNRKKSVAMIYWFALLQTKLLPARLDFWKAMLHDRYALVGGSESCSLDCSDTLPSSLLNSTEREKFRRYSLPVEAEFKSMAVGSAFSDDVREILLANYFERTADVLFNGTDCLLIRFFQTCFLVPPTT